MNATPNQNDRCAVCGVSFAAHGVSDFVPAPREMTDEMRLAAEEAAFGWPRAFAKHYRAAIAAISSPTPKAEKPDLRILAVLEEAIIKIENDRTLWTPEWQVWLADARAAFAKATGA